jgi:hypothetical protein
VLLIQRPRHLAGLFFTCTDVETITITGSRTGAPATVIKRYLFQKITGFITVKNDRRLRVNRAVTVFLSVFSYSGVQLSIKG